VVPLTGIPTEHASHRDSSMPADYDAPCTAVHSRRAILKPAVTRHLRAIFRIAALVLLMQAGLDVSSDATAGTVCLADAAVAAAPLQIAAQSPAGTETVMSEEHSTPMQGVPVHVDDCFCCSPCVDVAAVEQPIAISFVKAVRSSLPVRRVPILATTPFHPPQLLS